MLDLTHDDQRGRELIPNAKKGKNNKEKPVDFLNAMENWVVHGENVVVEIKKRLKIFEQKMEELGDLREPTDDLSQDVVAQPQSLEEFQAIVINSVEALKAQVEELHVGLEETKNNLVLCKKTVASGVLNTNVVPLMRVNVLRPRGHRTKRDA